MNVKSLLITGGNGLVGRALTPLLSDYEVTHFDLTDPQDGNRFIYGDLCDKKALAKACDGMDAVFHIAALHGQTWEKAGGQTGFRVNVLGTNNVIESAAEAGVSRVIFTSSIWATGHDTEPPYLPIDEELPREPAEPYGLTKMLGEKICSYASARYGMSTIVLRPGGIAPPEAYDPEGINYMFFRVDVRDVAQAHLLALQAPAGMLHDVFIVTADSPLCRIDAETYCKNPRKALLTLFPEISEREDLLSSLTLNEWYSIDKARRMLSYEPKYNFSP